MRLFQAGYRGTQDARAGLKKPLLWHSWSSRTCLWTIVCTPCKASPVLPCITAYSAMVCQCCQKKKRKKRVRTYPIGYFHVNIAEAQTGEGGVYLFAAIGKTAKFVCAQLHDDATRATARSFPEHLIIEKYFDAFSMTYNLNKSLENA